MTHPANPDVWAPPETSVQAPPATGGPELAYALPRPLFRRETRAWIRATRWWAHPTVAGLALMLSGATLVLGVAGVLVGMSPLAISVGWVVFGAMPLVLALRPYGLARAMSRRSGRDAENHLRIDGGTLVLTNVRELTMPLSRLTDVRDRGEVYWLLFGRRLVVFVPKRPRLGDVDAFLREVEAHRADTTPEKPLGETLARAAFRPPSRVVHAGRTYATSLRSPLFLLVVVFIALCFMGAVAAMPWQVSRDLVVPLALMGSGMVVVLLAPALNILLSGRDIVGEPGTVTVWSAHPGYLRTDGPSGAVDIPWADVVGLRRIGGFGVLELTNGRIILGLSDTVTGDPIALFRAIETHAGARSRE